MPLERLLAKRDQDNMNRISSLLDSVNELSRLHDHEMAVCYSLHDHDSTFPGRAEELRQARNGFISMLETEIGAAYRTASIPQTGPYRGL